MKRFYIRSISILTILTVISCSKDSSSTDEQNNTPEPEPVYLVLAENGITIKATEQAIIGETYDLNGKSYTIIDESNFYEFSTNPNFDWSLTVLKNVESMVCWFGDCPTSGKPEHIINFNQDISHWDTSTVKDMEGLFAINQKFQQDISKWDVRNVENMGGMFYGSKFNSDISDWNTSSVTNLSNLFVNNNTFTGDISNWDTSNVTNMATMFEYSNVSPDISKWDTRNVTTMERMFRGSAGYANSNMDISNWNTANVTNMRLMFSGSGYNPDVSGWNVDNVTNCNSFGISGDNRPAFSNCN